MRVSQEEKERSHERIVASAARLVRERGIGSTSVADVMGEAGLTHGGFYRHFDTKDALLEAALQSAFDQMASGLEAQLGRDGPEAAASYQAHYLSQGHMDRPGIGCPMAALGGEVARGPDALKAVFGAGVNRMIAKLAECMQGSDQEKQANAMRELAMLAGAIVIARASDPDTARIVLSACRGGSGGV